MGTLTHGMAGLQQYYLAHLQHEGAVNGLGSPVDQVQPRAGLSATEQARKLIENAHYANRRTVYPGALDKLSGVSDEFVESFIVWVGGERANLEFEWARAAPPRDLPAGHP